MLEEKLASLATVAGEDTTGLSKRQASFKSIDAVMKLMKDVDLPTSLKEAGVPSMDLKPLAEYIVNERQFLYDLQTFNPTKPTLENVTELLERMWEGRIGKNCITFFCFGIFFCQFHAVQRPAKLSENHRVIDDSIRNIRDQIVTLT